MEEAYMGESYEEHAGETVPPLAEALSLTGIESKDSVPPFDVVKHEKYITYLMALHEIDAKRNLLSQILKEINKLTREQDELNVGIDSCESDIEESASGSVENESIYLLGKERKESLRVQKRKQLKVQKMNQERKIRALRNLYEEENLELIIMISNAMRLQEGDPERDWKDLEVEPVDDGPTEENMYKQLAEAICGSVMEKGMAAPKGPCYKAPITPCSEEVDDSIEHFVETDRKSKRKSSCRDKILKNMIAKLRKMQAYLKTISNRKGAMVNISNMQRSIAILKEKLFEMCEGHGGPVLQPLTEEENWEVEKIRKSIEDTKLEIYKKDAELKILGQSVCAQSLDTSLDKKESLRKSNIFPVNQKQEKLKQLLKDQAEEIDIYATKCNEVNAKVEKQEERIELMGELNRKFEINVNMKIEEIRLKFESKVIELERYPTKVEIVREKIKNILEQQEIIEQELEKNCKIAKEAKKLMEKKSLKKKPDCSIALKKCIEDYFRLKKGHEICAQQKEEDYQNLNNLRIEIENVKNECAQTICSISEQTQNYKKEKNERIEDLKDQILQCRTSTCLAVGDREDEIKELECKIAEYSCRFDKAQETIRTLRKTLDELRAKCMKNVKKECR